MTGLGMVLAPGEETADTEHFPKMCVKKANQYRRRLRQRS